MYKKITPCLIHIDDLARHCGLFCDSELNNGYGCNSKSKEKAEPGQCFAWDCPIAYEADKKDFKKFDAVLYAEYKDNDQDSGWVVQYRQ